jgi:hypothetical protein
MHLKGETFLLACKWAAETHNHCVTLYFEMQFLEQINFCSFSAQQPEISLKIFGSALSIIRDEIISDTSQRRNWGRLDIPSVITPSHLYWRWRPFHAIDLYNPSGANISGLALWKNRSVQLNAPNSKQVTRIALINGPETGFGTALIAMLRTGARESWM